MIEKPAQPQNIAQPPQTAPEQAPEEQEAQQPNSGPGFLSPIGILIMFSAVFFDLISFLIMCFGFDDVGILDAMALFFVGGLMFISSGSMTTTKGGKKIMGKMLKRVGLTTFIELIPYVGGISPSWTIAAFLHLRNK